MNRRILAAALLACVSGVALIAFSFVDAAPPITDSPQAANEPERMSLEKLTIVAGKIASWTSNKDGDVDGFKVGENTLVHFPPHHAEEVSAWLKIDDDVTVFAKPKSRPDGTELMEAVVLRRGEEAKRVPSPRPREGKQGPGYAADQEEQRMSVSGKVTELHENREGIVDGFKVDDKAEVKFPPHQTRRSWQVFNSEAR